MKRVDLKPLEELFRAEVFRFLKKEGKITDDLIQKLMSWKHSGFSVDNGVRIEKIWKDDPLICPECDHEMRIISFITEIVPIEKILKYLDL